MIPIPIGDENPTSRRPFVNYALIGANGLVFLWFNVVRGSGFFELSPADIQDWGLLPGHPTPLTFLSSMFLHAGPWHLLANMWFLHIFGDNVEDKLGGGKYLLLYLGWGALAGGAFLLFGGPLGRMAIAAPDMVRRWNETPLVGASGAISGVMGAYLVFFPRARIKMIVWLFILILPFTLPALLVIGLYFIQDLVLGITLGTRMVGGTAYTAHTGGMVAGILAALLLKPLLRRGVPETEWDRDTGFARRDPGLPPVTIPDGAGGSVQVAVPSNLPDLRDRIVGAVLDGRMDLALELHRRWAADPRSWTLPPAVALEIAHEMLRRGRVEEAEAGYRKYLEGHPPGPDAAEAKFRLGLIRARAAGDREQAREWLRQAAAEHPNPETAAYARRELEKL